jgi:tetratricopeptide repeat protein
VSGRARRHRACRLAVLVWLLTGCATAYRSGEVALEEGRYEDASAKFGEALAGHPDRPEALFGLGLAQYRLGSFDAAVASLGRAVLVSPDRADVRLYLALGYLALGSQDLAAGQLAVLLELDIHPRIAAQAGRALRLLRGEALRPRSATSSARASTTRPGGTRTSRKPASRRTCTSGPRGSSAIRPAGVLSGGILTAFPVPSVGRTPGGAPARAPAGG